MYVETFRLPAPVSLSVSDMRQRTRPDAFVDKYSVWFRSRRWRWPYGTFGFGSADTAQTIILG